MRLDLKLYFDSNTIEGRGQDYYAVVLFDEDSGEYRWVQIKDQNDNVVMEITTEEFLKLSKSIEKLVEMMLDFDVETDASNEAKDTSQVKQP